MLRIRTIGAILAAFGFFSGWGSSALGDPASDDELASSTNQQVQGRGEGKDNWWDALPRPAWSAFEKIDQSQSWFDVYEIQPEVFAIYEPGQFEEVISYLIVGSQRALLLDTGLGIGDMHRLVRELTDKEVAVINSHTHYDHVGGNHAFDTIYGTGLDYTRRHEKGRPHEKVAEFVGEGWIWKDPPEGFSTGTYASRPFQITERVKDGQILSLGDVELEVLLTPGHAPDSLCLLDRQRRLLFTGDTFYPATLYAHLPGSTFEEYARTAARLASLAEAVDLVLPAHNEPTMPSHELVALHDAFAALPFGEVTYVLTDGDREYDFGRFSILVSDPPPWETPTADLVITGGRVYTFTWGEPAVDGTPSPDAPYGQGGWRPDAEAVAIQDGKVLLVGSAQDVKALIGPQTKVFEADGATVLPGLVDSHTHVAGLGELAASVNLIGVATEEEAVARVVERAQSTPAGEWILGRGWDEGAWANRYPTLELLSQRVPDHPVVLDSLHGFAVWGNRLAFEAAGITRETPTPAGGEILRDADGHPSGVVLNRAGVLLRSAIPEPTPAQFKGYMLAGLEQMARDGYVAVHEAGSSRRHMEALESLAAAGQLPIRVYAMLSARDGDLCREWLSRGPISGVDGMLAVRSVKAYYDAALGSRGARLLADYSDMPGHRGTSGGEYGFDQELVAQMMRGGFQVGIHAIGDAGNRETLDFLQRVVAETPEARAHRHRIEHAQVIHPEDFARFAPLGIIASMEPPHAVEDKAWAEERLGPERIRGAYAWRTLRQAGVELTFNSDLSGSDHSIFYGLHAAITRRDKERQPPDGWYPEQSLTPEEAIRAYTSWSAYAAHWEQHTGTLAPGRWADLTLMDVDPLVLGKTDPSKLLDGRIVATVVAGKFVFQE